MKLTLNTVERKCGAPTLLVLLPGAYMKAADFVNAGFFEAVARRHLALDLVAVDLDLEAISGGTALPALQAQIIEPARQQGYKNIWLGGISLGGLLALCHHADTPDCIDGLCLLAPYPGSRITRHAIAQAGGMARWQASAEELEDPEFRAWQWLQKPPSDFPVFIGYGTEDRFAAGMAQVAECFPATAHHAISGGHEWPVWQQLWERFLDSGKLPS